MPIASMTDERLLELMGNEIFLSDDFAVVLGLKESTVDPERNPKDEFDRVNQLSLYTRRNRMESEEQQEVVWARFSALYLPACVDKFLEPPKTSYQSKDHNEDLKLDNAYMHMLNAVQHSPYFHKYLRSNKPIAAGGKRLPRVIAERLAAVAPRWERQMSNNPRDKPEDYYVSAAATVVQLLDTLLVSFAKHPDQDAVVPWSIRRALDPYVQRWARRYIGQILGDVSVRAIISLGGNHLLWDEARDVRRRFKNWDHCGLPSCDNREGLKACSRCQTIRYCSPEHQRQHWSPVVGIGLPHKELCHRTAY